MVRGSLIQSKYDYQIATKINEDLHTTKNSLNDLSDEFTELNREINIANVDCEDQAPCMATRNDIWKHHLETPEGIPPLPQAALNPGWGDFSDWSQCSATCGAGQISRTRLCTPINEENGFKNFTVCDGYPQECFTSILYIKYINYIGISEYFFKFHIKHGQRNQLKSSHVSLNSAKKGEILSKKLLKT